MALFLDNHGYCVGFLAAPLCDFRLSGAEQWRADWYIKGSLSLPAVPVLPLHFCSSGPFMSLQVVREFLVSALAPSLIDACFLGVWITHCVDHICVMSVERPCWTVYPVQVRGRVT